MKLKFNKGRATIWNKTKLLNSRHRNKKMMTRTKVPALPTRLVNPRNKKQRWPQPSQPGLGEEQRLKGVEVAKFLRLHSQAPTASIGGLTVTQKWPIRNTRSTSPTNIRVLTNKREDNAGWRVGFECYRSVIGQHFLHWLKEKPQRWEELYNKQMCNRITQLYWRRKTNILPRRRKKCHTDGASQLGTKWLNLP